MDTLRDALRRLRLSRFNLMASQGRRSGHTTALARDPPSEHRFQAAQQFLCIGEGRHDCDEAGFLFICAQIACLSGMKCVCVRRNDTANDTGICASMKLEYDMTVAAWQLCCTKPPPPCLDAYLPMMQCSIHLKPFSASPIPFCSVLLPLCLYPPMLPPFYRWRKSRKRGSETESPERIKPAKT